MGASAFLKGDQFQVKQIALKPEAKISFQKHIHRAEHWVLVRGTAKIVKGEKTFTLEQNESIYIPPGVYHQLENPGQHPLDLIEIRTGRYLHHHVRCCNFDIKCYCLFSIFQATPSLDKPKLNPLNRQSPSIYIYDSATTLFVPSFF
jgi:mannose-6-phosphate isomerase-like protein (cupin superfamily)